MNRHLQALRAQHDQVRAAMDNIENGAADAGRDLTDDENAQLDTLATRAETLSADIARSASRHDNLAASADIFARMEAAGALPSMSTRGRQAAEFTMTPGEYANLCVRAFSDLRDPAALEILTRTLQHETSGSDASGLLPVPIFGDLVKFVDANRYLVNAARSLPMPDKGATFTRPRVTQFTSVGAQASQGDVLSSRKFQVTGDTVTKTTQGGTVSASEQFVDWTDPAALDLVVQDLAEQYAIDTEDVTCTAVESAVTTNNTDLSATGDSAAFFAAVGDAAQNLYANAKALPDAMLCSVDRWGYLISLTDGDDRPIFPTLAPFNAPGTLEAGSFNGNPLGLKLVVSPQFSSGFMALASTKRIEVYERNKGQIALPSPSTLEVNIAYRGYFATYVRAEGLWGMKDV